MIYKLSDINIEVLGLTYKVTHATETRLSQFPTVSLYYRPRQWFVKMIFEHESKYIIVKSVYFIRNWTFFFLPVCLGINNSHKDFLELIPAITF